MTESFNGGGTVITGDDNLLLPVPLLWRLPITFGSGMMNAI